MSSRKSALYSKVTKGISTPNQADFFYVWYVEQCRRLEMKPLTCVKPVKLRSYTKLTIKADSIKPQEWIPVFKALQKDISLRLISIKSKSYGQYEFLEEVNSQEKANLLRRSHGSLYTTYILKMLLQSIGICLRRNNSLVCLDFKGVPVSFYYLTPIWKSLKVNKSLKVLNFIHCPIKDRGCQLICRGLRDALNIEVLNLSACSIGVPGAQAIANLMKYQHNFLNGLKRITLNDNPLIGNEGLRFILEELFDELSIKTLDMQRCGITEKIAHRLLVTVKYSPSLDIADFSENKGLSRETLRKLWDIMSNKQPVRNVRCEGYLKWSTLNDESGESNIMNHVRPIRSFTSSPVSTCRCIIHELRAGISNIAPLKSSNATEQRNKLQNSNIPNRIYRYLESMQLPTLQAKMVRFDDSPCSNFDNNIKSEHKGLKDRIANNKFVLQNQGKICRLLPTLIEDCEGTDQIKEATGINNFQLDDDDDYSFCLKGHGIF